MYSNYFPIPRDWTVRDYFRAGCAVLGCLVFLTVTASWWMGREELKDRELQHTLDHEVESVAASILTSLGQYEQILRGVRGFIEGSDEVSAEEFRAFVAVQNIQKSTVGLQGVALVLNISHDEKNSHEAGLRSLGVPGYQIRPDGIRESYAPIVYIEPKTQTNAKVIGLDIFSVPPAKAAAIRARDTSGVAVTEMLTLGQDEPGSRLAGYVMYLPIFGKTKGQNSAQRGPDRLLGWADAPFHARDLFTSASLSVEKGLRLQIFEGESMAEANRAFGLLDGQELAYQDVTKSQYVSKKSIAYGGRQWTLAMEPTDAYLALHLGRQHHALALLGVALSLAAGLITWLLLSARDRAKNIAIGMTEKIRTLSSEMDDTLNAVPDLLFELTLDGKYEGYRAHRLDLLAAPPSDFLGKTIAEVLPADAAQTCLSALAEANQTGFSSGQQIKLPVGDTERWFELSVAKRATTADCSARFVMLSREITQRVRSAEQLAQSEGALTEAQRVAGLGHFWIDTKTQRWTGAPACCELLGFDTTQSKELQEVAELVEPRMREDFLKACLDNHPDVSSNFQFRLTRPDGQVRWMLMCSAKRVSADTTPQLPMFTLQDISKLRDSEDQLRLLEKAVAGLNDIVLITEAEPINHPGPRILFVNDAFVRRTGYTREEVLGKSPKLLQGPATQKDELARIRKALESWQPVRAELINYTKSGTPFWLELDIQPIADAHGWFTHWVAIERDITDRKQVESTLRESEVRYRSMFEDNPHPMWVFDTSTLKFLSVNDAAVQNYGYSREEFLEMTLQDIRPPNERTKLESQLATDVNLPSTGIQVWKHLRKDGSQIEVEISGHALNYQGRSARLILANDITERRKVEDKIEQLAYYDPLTQLPNRTMFFSNAKNTLAEAAVNHTTGACILIDLDNFKTINDNWGHRNGDLLLLHASQQIRQCVSQDALVARLGGDEFAIVLMGSGADAASPVAYAQQACERILAALAVPCSIEGREHHTSGSIGIALFGQHPLSVDELLSQADAAMYQAKADGRNTFRFFDLELQSELAARSALEADLRHSINRNELSLVYQPQIDRDGQVIGVEALVRWSHAERGPVSPAEFIPIAESSGFILKIGQWVLHTACMTQSQWRLEPLTAGLTMAVNVSARQFHHPDFVSQVELAVSQTGANPRMLKLEMTESMLAHDLDSVVQKMTALKKMGIKFSLDDFGTGYSSLAYLKKLPLDQLKIDQSFVREILQNSNDAAIVRTVIALGDVLKLQVIAEGVETQGQRDFLESNGCYAYQGYFFSRPVSTHALAEFIKKTNSDADDTANALV